MGMILNKIFRFLNYLSIYFLIICLIDYDFEVVKYVKSVNYYFELRWVNMMFYKDFMRGIEFIGLVF